MEVHTSYSTYANHTSLPSLSLCTLIKCSVCSYLCTSLLCDIHHVCLRGSSRTENARARNDTFTTLFSDFSILIIFLFFLFFSHSHCFDFPIFHCSFLRKTLFHVFFFFIFPFHFFLHLFLLVFAFFSDGACVCESLSNVCRSRAHACSS